jgi:hypothetical protein
VARAVVGPVTGGPHPLGADHDETGSTVRMTFLRVDRDAMTTHIAYFDVFDRIIIIIIIIIIITLQHLS